MRDERLNRIREAYAEELAPPKPRLVSDQKPALSVADYVAERIKAVKGGKLAFRDVYRDYEATAQRSSNSPPAWPSSAKARASMRARARALSTSSMCALLA